MLARWEEKVKGSALGGKGRNTVLASVTENARQVMATEMGALAMATDEKGSTWRRGVARLSVEAMSEL